MRTALLSLLSVGAAGCDALRPIEAVDLEQLSPEARAQVQLGRALFFEPGLSGAGDVSCASCHDPEHYGAEPLPTSVGTGGAALSRNAPSVLNAGLKRLQFWDGRADTLEAQALGPLLADDEMGQTEAGLIDWIEAHPEGFAQAFPGEIVPTVDQVTRALAAYQRALPSPSRFDRYLQGERALFTADEAEGLSLFRRDCAFCHSGAGLGGTKLRELGEDVPWPADRRDDLGRAEVTGRASDEMVFVVPSLRNVSETGPWFHDGSVETLEEAVALMGRHQLGEDLSDREIEGLVAFLGTLRAESLPAWAYPPEASALARQGG